MSRSIIEKNNGIVMSIETTKFNGAPSHLENGTDNVLISNVVKLYRYNVSLV